MLLRFPIQGNRDWCVRTHVSTPIGENDIVGPVTWVRCCVVSRNSTDDEIAEYLSIPDELNDITSLYTGDPEAVFKITSPEILGKRNIETIKSFYTVEERAAWSTLTKGERAAWGTLTEEERAQRRREAQKRYYERHRKKR